MLLFITDLAGCPFHGLGLGDCDFLDGATVIILVPDGEGFEPPIPIFLFCKVYCFDVEVYCSLVGITKCGC